MKQLKITENVAHAIGSSESEIAAIPFGTDTFVLENDKIRFHSVSTFVKMKK